MRCKNCKSNKVVKAGRHRNRKGWYQKWKCKDCGFTSKGIKIG